MSSAPRPNLSSFRNVGAPSPSDDVIAVRNPRQNGVAQAQQYPAIMAALRRNPMPQPEPRARVPGSGGRSRRAKKSRSRRARKTLAKKRRV